MVSGVTATGVYQLELDWKRLKGGPVMGHMSCVGTFREEDGSEAVLCPRTILRRAVERAAAAGLTFLIGFEIEFTMLERTGDPTEKYRMIPHDGQAWSMARSLASWGASGSVNKAFEEMLRNLQSCAKVEQSHAEAGPGQYEIVLAPETPLEACDTLIHARQIIESTAARHGFRATLHPRPFAGGIGNGAHAHMSITSPHGDCSAVYERFYGGILAHFGAVFAFTNSHPASYERMVDGMWAGGRWVTWGVHNKQAPLRKCKNSHWEVKVMDGMANPYLAMAALINAGTAGAEFTWRDCEEDPATLSSAERSALGIKEQMPRNLGEALGALQKDATMVKLMGEQVVERFVAVKKAEIELMGSMSEADQRTWVLDRY
ncbi:hypothetical protein F4777DRAFT_564123 [Nemania sp. FL0916]|nr:hypothetical protein F4777DRAFT_564123 [Nemania sp. FL0916]